MDWGKLWRSSSDCVPEKVDEAAEKIIERLRGSGGFLSVTDQSRPETIYMLLWVSKKTFKKAIGGLYRKHRIIIENNGIRLI